MKQLSIFGVSYFLVIEKKLKRIYLGNYIQIQFHPRPDPDLDDLFIIKIIIQVYISTKQRSKIKMIVFLIEVDGRVNTSRFLFSFKTHFPFFAREFDVYAKSLSRNLFPTLSHFYKGWNLKDKYSCFDQKLLTSNLKLVLYIVCFTIRPY